MNSLYNWPTHVNCYHTQSEAQVWLEAPNFNPYSMMAFLHQQLGCAHCKLQIFLEILFVSVILTLLLWALSKRCALYGWSVCLLQVNWHNFNGHDHDDCYLLRVLQHVVFFSGNGDRRFLANSGTYLSNCSITTTLRQ
jgi:hypothetical protein